MRTTVGALMAAAIAAVLFGASSFAQPSGEPQFKPYPAPRITESQWNAYFERVKAAHGASMWRRPDLHLVGFHASGGIAYAFTQPGHPAHPAWIARRPVEQG